MKKAIWIRLVLLTLISVIICSATSAVIWQNHYEKQTIESISSLIEMAAKTDTRHDASALSRLMDFYRVTVIQKDGSVLSDSHTDAEALDNHGERPEVTAAIESGRGISKRFSDTLDKSMLYVAVKENDLIYRASVPLSGLNSSFTRQIPALLAGLALAILVSSLLAGQIAKSTLVPLKSLRAELKNVQDGRYDQPLPQSQYDEIATLVQSINQLGKSISDSIQSLANEKDKLTFILENIQQGLLVIDQNRKIVQYNQTAKRLFSCSQNDLTGKPLTYLTHEKQVIEAAGKCITSKDTFQFDLPMSELDRIYGVSMAYINSGWLKDGAILLFTDVTQDRQAQRLRQQFVANASHELKTPITSIQGFSELLSGGMVTDPQKQKEYLNRIQEQACQMAAIINKILSLSSLEEEKEPPKAQPIPIRPTAEEVIAGAAPLAGEKELSIQLSCDPKRTISLSQDHLHQLLSNLLSNAIKYNVRGGRIDIVCEEADHGKTRIIIKDTGIGIDPKDMPRMFERFYRGERPKSVDEGSGLGLSIVKHIISNNNGQIQVDSIPGVGTTITIVI